MSGDRPVRPAADRVHRSTAMEDPTRIGVYVCHCGTNIAGTVDVAAVRDWAAERLGPHGVVVARDYPFMCSSLGQELIEKDIRELGLTRVVVAACSPHMHEKTFRGACQRAGLNPYLCELVSIREQVSWVHTDKAAATAKAKAIVAGGVLRVREQVPLEPLRVPINPATLVVGGGIAGISAALEIADAGFPVHLVEREPSIGGHMAQFDKTFPTLDCAACILTPKMVTAGTHPNITLHTWSEVTDVSRLRRQLHRQGPAPPALRRHRPVHRLRHLPGEMPGQGRRPRRSRPGSATARRSTGRSRRRSPSSPSSTRTTAPTSSAGTCKACEKLCAPGAIDFDQQPEEVDPPGRQHRPGHRLRGLRCAAHRTVRLRATGERLHQPRVRADEQRQRTDRRADRPARRGHHPAQPWRSSTASAAGTATSTTTAPRSAACRA